MDPQVARRIARRNHRGQHTRFGDPVVDHLALRRARWIAGIVKLADLDDHLAHGWIPSGAPPYVWARRCLLEQIEIEPSIALADGL
jgi:hypothetical protein